MRKRVKRNKPDEGKLLEKMIRAHRADVAPYRLLYESSYIINQPIQGRTFGVLYLDDVPYKEVSESDPEYHESHDSPLL